MNQPALHRLIKTIDHVTVPVRDLDGAERFYKLELMTHAYGRELAIGAPDWVALAAAREVRS